MNALVTQARIYLGTPYRHRGRTARGLDCAGLPWKAYADLGLVLPDLKIYGREPYKDGLVQAMVAALGEPVWRGTKPKREMLQVGDVVACAFVTQPHHLGVIGDDKLYGFSMIHADGNVNKKVVEQGLDERLLGMIVAIFRRPV